MPFHAPHTLQPPATEPQLHRAEPSFAERTSTTDSSDSSPTWIGTTRAKRLLGVGSENTVKSWVRYGYLRGRRLPNGRTQVLHSDVLRFAEQPPSP